MSSESDIQSQLGVARRSFAGQLPKRQADLEAALAQWLTSGEGADLVAFRRLAHNLSGAGGTYGFPGLSKAAQALEQEISGLIAAGAIPEAADTGVLRSLVEAVAQTIAEAQRMSASEQK